MEFQVEVEVTGQASDPDDAALPGVYSHTVVLTRAVDLSDLSPGQAGAIAESVLDEFHDNQGIECLDDFKIVVRLSDSGLVIEELDDENEHDSDLVKSVQHDGQISSEQEGSR